MRRNEIAGEIQTGFAFLRIEFPEPVADRHIRTDDQHDVRKSFIPMVVDFIENAPSRKHPHDSCLPGARCHLAGIAMESRKTMILFLIADFFLRDIDAL